MVRAGESGYLIDDFIENKIVAIGWKDVGDLTSIDNINELKTILRETYQDYKDFQVNLNAGQIMRFKKELRINDHVITYSPSTRYYWIAKILSDYEYNPKLTDYHNIRRVEWIDKVSRDDLSIKTKNSLGSALTIFKVANESISEIFALLSGSKIPKDPVEKEDSLEILKDDFIAKAHEFIKDKVLTLDWEDMQELVAGIIRAMGYKTRVSPRGADRGKDILASPDGLGLEEPRILVEVKHRQGTIGAPEVRSFLGGLRQNDKGLYVSTGGFTREAKYEAERSNTPLSLVDADLLISLIIQYYDHFDSETKALIPLKKIYWPV